MNRKTGSILLVAGTCIGSGMIALPMVLAKIGLLPSIALMLGIWAVMYATSLVSLELNLQAKQGLSLGELGKFFSGPKAQTLGIVSLKLLSYALLAVFIYGGTSVLEKLFQIEGSFKLIATQYTAIAFVLLLLPIKWVDYVNRFLFMGLMAIVAVLITGLALKISWSHLPLYGPNADQWSSWQALIPVVFTSFGFQVIFHTLTNYCQKDASILKSAFFWGSLIPAFVYILWTSSVLSVVFHENPIFYNQIVIGKADVGDLIGELSRIAQWPGIQQLVWWTSLLAIVTSVLGVGVGLCESLKKIIAPYVPGMWSSVLAALATLCPAYVVAILVPNAFISVLGFAGMILVVIAIFLPLYLLRKAQFNTLFYSALSKPALLVMCAVVGLIIAGCEMINILS